MDDKLLMPGAFARRSRLSAKALRLYASNGILIPAEVNGATGYRRYHPNQLQEARVLRLLRRSEMPLAVVGQVLAAPRAQRSRLIAEYRAGAEREFQRRLEMLSHVERSLSGGKDIYPMHEIKTRNVAEQTVLTEQSYLTATDLSHWIATTGMRQLDLAASIGGQVGPSMVIYHGEVNEDSDGPVESCVPVNPGRAAEANLPIRIEAAHCEAFTTVTRAQIRYPDLLSAYDALEQWISEHGQTLSGSPREIYFADPSSGPDDEPVADVAMPIQARTEDGTGSVL